MAHHGGHHKKRSQNHREFLKNDAAMRHAKRAMRTPAQQLEVLDMRLGVGVGAKRERARLAPR